MGILSDGPSLSVILSIERYFFQVKHSKRDVELINEISFHFLNLTCLILNSWRSSSNSDLIRINYQGSGLA